jgi:mannose-6-phosphate isomerase-like protein (cupin superfamily)
MSNHTHHTTTAVIGHRHEPETGVILGGSIAVRLRAADTDGRIGLIEQVIPGGFPGPALHVHPEFEETFYILDGSLVFRVGDHAYEADAGTVAHIPRGVPHTFANTADEPAHSLVIVTPAGFEQYFEALAAAIERHGAMPHAGEVVALGIAHGSMPA